LNQSLSPIGARPSCVLSSSTSQSNPSIAFWVEYFAVRVFEHVLFKPAAPAVCQVQPVQVLADVRLVQQAHPKLHRRPEKADGTGTACLHCRNYGYEDGGWPVA
jgi:hypothetical protein